jgi:hypothetical protein
MGGGPAGVLTVDLHGHHSWATGVRLFGPPGELRLECFGDQHPHSCAVVGRPRIVDDRLHLDTDPHGPVVVRAIGPEDDWPVFPVGVSTWEAVQQGLQQPHAIGSTGRVVSETGVSCATGVLRLSRFDSPVIVGCVELQFDDLPRWEFTVEEFTPGGYRVRAVRDGGITGEGNGVDPDALLDEYKAWARGVERDLANRS